METMGLLLNVVGAIILALSTNRFFKWVVLSIKAFDVFMGSYASNLPTLAVTGSGENVQKEYGRTQKWMGLGVGLVVLGFILQLVAAMRR
jgi:uncharacterized membrane protein YGL010W